MMSDNLFDMLEYAALGTEWREWLKEVEKTADRPVTGRQDMVRPVPAGRPLPGQHRIGLCGGHLREQLPHPTSHRGAVLHGGGRADDAP